MCNTLIILEYKNFKTKIEYDSNSKVYHGKIEGINDLVTFESYDKSGIESEFRKAVDDYLDLCKSLADDTANDNLI